MIDINPTLKSQADKKVKKENSFLYESYFNSFIIYLFHFKCWYHIVILTLISFFFLQFINIDFLNIIEIKGETVKQLIESRATNIVTLISATFAVIGFLIANLAIKHSYMYNLMFKKSRFFSIIYFVLTLIASFIILSALKDYISIENVKRIFLVGTYLALIGIFFIGYLFTRLILYTNDKYLNQIVREDFYFESKRYLKYQLTSYYMKGIVFKQLGIGAYNNYFQNRFIGYTSDKFSVGTVVKDIKIEKVKDILKKNNIPMTDLYLNLNIEENFAINQNGFFFILDNSHGVDFKPIISELNKCVILEKANVDLLPIEEVLDYINDKIIEHTSKNNHKQVSEYTNIYSEYYQLQIKTKSYA
jgi:hypothetical protein